MATTSTGTLNNSKAAVNVKGQSTNQKGGASIFTIGWFGHGALSDAPFGQLSAP